MTMTLRAPTSATKKTIPRVPKPPMKNTKSPKTGNDDDMGF